MNTTDDMKETKKWPPLSVRLDDDVRTEIDKLAKADRRSLSAYINIALREHVERKAKSGRK